MLELFRSRCDPSELLGCGPPAAAAGTGSSGPARGRAMLPGSRSEPGGGCKPPGCGCATAPPPSALPAACRQVLPRFAGSAWSYPRGGGAVERGRCSAAGLPSRRAPRGSWSRCSLRLAGEVARRREASCVNIPWLDGENTRVLAVSNISCSS